MEQQEKGEVTMVQDIYKQYYKVISHLFAIFAQSGFSVKNKVKTFDQYKERVAVMNVNELYALLKEHGYSERVSLEETKCLTRLINTNNHRNELDNLDMEGFKQFLLQLGLYLHQYLSSLPPSFALH